MDKCVDRGEEPLGADPVVGNVLVSACRRQHRGQAKSASQRTLASLSTAYTPPTTMTAIIHSR